MISIIIPKTWSSKPLKGKYISAKGMPIMPNKKAPQVGQPTPKATIPEPKNPKNPLPSNLLNELYLYKIMASKIPAKDAVIRLLTILNVTKPGPDIITEILILLSATLATKK